MIHIFTNRRLVNSTTANVLDAKLRIEHYDIKSEDIVIGVFGETEVSRIGVPKVDDGHLINVFVGPRR